MPNQTREPQVKNQTSPKPTHGVIEAFQRWFPVRAHSTIILIIAAAIYLLLELKTAPPETPDEVVTWSKLLAPQMIVYVIMAIVALRWKKYQRRDLLIIIAAAALFRVVLIPQLPSLLSSDVFRYVWDGRVQMAGINPYRYVPEDEHLVFLRDNDVFTYINRRDYAPTIYPPASQMIFLAVCAISPNVSAMKLTMVLFDLVTIMLLALILARLKLNPSRLIIYAWHPMAVWEFGHSGHIDAAAIAFICAALLARLSGRKYLTGIMLGIATLIKLQPIILFPVLWESLNRRPLQERLSRQPAAFIKQFWRRTDWRMPVALLATIALGYLPYIKVGWRVLGFLPNYIKEEGFETGARFYFYSLLLRFVNAPVAVYLVPALIILAGLAVVFVVRREAAPDSFIKRCAVLIATYLFLVTSTYPWYGVWLIPFLCFVPLIGLIYYSCLLPLAYLDWLRERYLNLPLYVWHIQYLPTYAILLLEENPLRRFWRARQNQRRVG